MTIFDLTEAIKRYKRLLIVGFTVLILAILLAVLTIKDGSIAWRASPTYEAVIQIGVVSPGTTSLTTVDSRSGELRDAAALYAALIRSDEAKLEVGNAIGLELDDAFATTVDSQAAVITVTAIGPTPDLAIRAAKRVFTWLANKLRQPLVAADTSTGTSSSPIALDRPFDSATEIAFDDSLGSVDSELFLQIAIDGDRSTILPIVPYAGEAITTRSTLSSTTSLVFSLQTSSDAVLDTLRIVPPPLPSVAQGVPVLAVLMNQGSIVRSTNEEGSTEWSLFEPQIHLVWSERSGASAVDDQTTTSEVHVVALTAEVGVTPIGGRRGPITAIAAFLVGSLVLLSTVIVADGWSRARESALDGSSEATKTARPSVEVYGPSTPMSQASHQVGANQRDRDMAKKP